jgi:hypothetical protein
MSVVNCNGKTYHASRRCERSEAIQQIEKGFFDQFVTGLQASGFRPEDRCFKPGRNPDKAWIMLRYARNDRYFSARSLINN